MPDEQRGSLHPHLAASRAVNMRHQPAIARLRHRLPQPHDLAGGGLAMLLIEGKRLQGWLVGCDEKDCGCLAGAVDVLTPRTARHCQGVERRPIEAVAFNDWVTAPFKRCNQQPGILLERERAFTWAQHLHEKAHGLEDRSATYGIDIFDH